MIRVRSQKGIPNEKGRREPALQTTNTPCRLGSIQAGSSRVIQHTQQPVLYNMGDEEGMDTGGCCRVLLFVVSFFCLSATKMRYGRMVLVVFVVYFAYLVAEAGA
jgi:hypothetical protein